MDPQHTFAKELTFSSVSDVTPTTLNHLHGRPRIVRASEVLLSLAGREINTGPPPPAGAAGAAGTTAGTTAVAENPGLESVHDVLRAFPPLSKEEGVSGSGSGSGKGDVQCPDCGAVFSSSYVSFLSRSCHVMSCFCPVQWGQRAGHELTTVQSRAGGPLPNQVLSR